jgi:hypothetical protein
MAQKIAQLNRMPRTARDFLERALAARRQAAEAAAADAAALHEIAEAYLRAAEAASALPPLGEVAPSG